MPPFRGTDESLDREIAAAESIARVRVRRAAREVRELDRDLGELRRERARRRAAQREMLGETTRVSPETESA